MFTLREYQTKSVAATIKFLLKDRGNPLIALPTGAGKTPVIAELVNKLDGKIVVISHVKEILEQNLKALEKHLPHRKISVNSAGLDRREVGDITVAGIQSIFRKPKLFKDFKYIIIDECHLIPNDGEGMYRTFLDSLKGIVIGLTATPYRTGWGVIYGKTKMFSDLVIDYTSGSKFTGLIELGYLSDLRTKATSLKLATDDIKLIGGDFDLKGLSKSLDKDEITKTAIEEVILKGKDRKKWLIFAIDIDHAEHIAELLLQSGISAMVLHSKMEFDRDKTIKESKLGKYQAVVNVNMLTTGYDDPSIDLVVLLRPTLSASLHVQMIGRGLRIAEGKKDCLVLDFAGNTSRLGAINNITVRERGEKRPGDGNPIMKDCPKCDEILFPAVRVCPSCGHKFVFKTRLENTSGNQDIIDTGKPKWHKVDSIQYSLHKKQNGPDTMVAMYFCNYDVYKEWVCIEHTGYAKHMANHWVKKRGIDEGIDTVKQLLDKVHLLKTPNKIRIDKSGKYNSIIDYSF